MRRVLACFAPVLLLAADPDPASFIPVDAACTVRVPDVQRSRARWEASPYAGLASTAWGRTLIGEWSGRAERALPGVGQVLDGLRAAAVAATPRDGRRPEVVVAVHGQEPHLRAAAAFLLPQVSAGVPVTFSGPGGRSTVHGPVLAWSPESGAALQPQGAAAPPEDRDADVELRLDVGPWLAAVPAGGGIEGGLGAGLARVQAVRVAVRLDPAGLRERIVLEPGPVLRRAAVAANRWADPRELRALPATTLWAVTWQADPVLTVELLPPADDPGTASFERLLAGAGLPALRETLLALDGPCTVLMSEGVPFPSLTCAWSLPQEMAERWIAAASARLNLVRDGAGAAGFAGLVPLAIGWDAGRLVLTTDPLGLAAWTRREPGFADHPAIAETLRDVPDRVIAIGAGRGGASWGALAQLAVPLFTAMGAPQAVSLPGDLRVASDRGWFHARLAEDGMVRIDAGGLAGGPCSAALMLGVSVPATLWLQHEQRRERRQRREEAEAPADVPAVPVF